MNPIDLHKSLTKQQIAHRNLFMNSMESLLIFFEDHRPEEFIGTDIISVSNKRGNLLSLFNGLEKDAQQLEKMLVTRDKMKNKLTDKDKILSQIDKSLISMTEWIQSASELKESNDHVKSLKTIENMMDIVVDLQICFEIYLEKSQTVN